MAIPPQSQTISTTITTRPVSTTSTKTTKPKLYISSTDSIYTWRMVTSTTQTFRPFFLSTHTNRAHPHNETKLRLPPLSNDTHFIPPITLNYDLPPEHWGPIPEIAIIGKSNAGKSTLLNKLVGRGKKGVAKTSKNPGRTQVSEIEAIG